TASAKSKEIVPNAHFQTFIKIFNNPRSSTSPIMASGQSFTNLVQTFWQNYQAKGSKNLGADLTKLDSQLDAQVKQAGGGNGGGGVPEPQQPQPLPRPSARGRRSDPRRA